MNTRRSQTKISKNDEKEPRNLLKLNKYVFFIEDDLLKGTGNIRLQKLRHPGNEMTSFYFIDLPRTLIYEVIQHKQQHRSWLIDESVSNGKIYLPLPVDIMFFALYYIRKLARNHALPIDQIFDEDHFDISTVLEQFTDEKMLSMISDVKQSGEIKAYRYNKDRALIWLRVKVKNLSQTLKDKDLDIGGNAVSANYIKSEIQSSENSDYEYKKAAAEIIGNYLTSDLYGELLESLHLTTEQSLGKRKYFEQSSGGGFETKKMKLESEVEPVKEKKVSAKSKALAKAASGTKSISSFFKK